MGIQSDEEQTKNNNPQRSIGQTQNDLAQEQTSQQQTNSIKLEHTRNLENS